MGGFSGLHHWENEMLFGVEALQVPPPQDTERYPSRYGIIAAVVLLLAEAQVTEMFVRHMFKRCSLQENLRFLLFFLEAKLHWVGEHNK